jgi:hypothetical protein
MISLSRRSKDDGTHLRTPMRMHLEDRDCTLTHTLKKLLGRLTIYDHTPLSLNRDRTISPLPVLLLHHNLIVHSPSRTYTERHLQNTLRMEGTLIQLVQIVSPSHRLNLGDHSMMFRHLPLGCADPRADLRHCMTRLLLVLLLLYFLEDQILSMIIHPLIPPSLRHMETNTIDPIGNPVQSLLVRLRPLTVIYLLPIVGRNDYLMNELTRNLGYLFLAGMILGIQLPVLACRKLLKSNVLSRMRIRMIQPDKRIGLQLWVI